MASTKKLTPKELQEAEERLRTMLQIVSGDIDQLEEEALGEDNPIADTTGEAGTDSFSMEMNLELLERDEKTLREIYEALDRIKDGTYGICEGCECVIGKERLKAMPHTRNCIDCQRKAEQGLL